MSNKAKRPWRLAGRIILTGVEAVLVLLFLVAGGYALFGYVDWHHTRKDLLTHGEKLNIAELAPPEIPDAQNFFADPMWRQLVQKPPLPRGQRLIDSLNPTVTAEDIRALQTKHPEYSYRFPGQFRGESRLAMARTQWFFLNPDDIRQQQSAARFTLDVLAPADPFLERIRLLLARPGSRMLPDYSDADLDMSPTSPFELGTAAQILSLQAKASLVLGTPDAAFDKILFLAALTRIGDREPVLSSLAARLRIAEMCVNRIQEGLASRLWTDEDLKTFENALSTVDLLKQLPLALRGHRATLNAWIQRGEYRMALDDPDADAWTKFSNDVVFKTWTLGLIPADQAFYNRSIQTWIDAADHATERGLGASRFSDAPVSKSKFLHPLSEGFLSWVSGLGSRVAWIQDRIIQARIACALERWHLKNNSYPATLSALVPAFLPALPPDVITLKPMYCQTKKPDGFRLWSVGWNETNEGGVPSEDYNRTKGDWVWEQPPSKADRGNFRH